MRTRRPAGRRGAGRHRARSLSALLLVVALLVPALGLPPWLSGRAAAQASGAPGRAPLRVAVREVPPFAMRDAAGGWEGLSVELWHEVADRLGREFAWVELPLDETLEALAAGRVDVGVAALTVTAEREGRLDFTHPYYVSGLSLAYPGGRGSAWLATLRGFVSLEFLSAVGTLALVLLVAGFAMWLFERRRNPEQFGRSPVRGLGDGFWWSAVTMTTVGYGDKAPQTLGGRVVALVWMFASLIIIAGFTASIAASLTANRLETSVLRARGLSELRVAVLEGSAAEGFAEAKGARVRGYARVEDALRALESDAVDVVLHDAPVLTYHARTAFDGVEVAPEVLVRDDYGFGLAPASPLREPLNAALLAILHEPVWQEIRGRYLGEEAAE